MVPIRTIFLQRIAICFSLLASVFNWHSEKPILSIHAQKDASGRVLLFMIDYEGYVTYMAQQEKNGPWGSEKVVGENVKTVIRNPGDPVPLYPKPVYISGFSQLTAALNSQARLVLFGTKSNSVYYSIQDKFEPDNWSKWEILGGSPLVQIAALQNNKGCLSLFGLTPAGDVLYREEANDPLDPNKFGIWKSLNTSGLDQIVCQKTPSGKLVVFGKKKTSCIIEYNSQLYPDSDNWTAWMPLDGTLVKQIDVEKKPDGRFTLLALGGDERLYERYQLVPEGSWFDWTTLEGSKIKTIETCKNKRGQIHVFSLNTDGKVGVKWQLGPGGNNWSGWFPFGGNKFRTISECQYEDGRVCLFAVDAGLNVQYKCQRIPDGDWEDWKILY